jgi:D-beta-D-heptose 7-phosphate kinase/D-beta-D-heptose 1-phosphate adenosyltransferase
MDAILELIDNWQRPRVIVVGDFMLDRLTYGNAERLAPDSPVPVLSTVREQWQPGGASNVCLCLAALQCDVTAFGIIGKDEAGQKLRDALAESGCDASGLLAVDDRPTTVKQSLIGLAQHRHPQKMFRLDFEQATPIDAATADQIVRAVEPALDGAVLCIEDYNKGLVTPELAGRLIAAAKQRNVPVMVDPAAIDDYDRYRGATCITPNRTEAEKATAMSSEDPGPLAEAIRDRYDIQTVAVTLDRHGVALLEPGKATELYPTEARAVYDVNGAGDMVLAALAGAVANRADWPTAVRFANLAAGLEVERFGVQPIPLDDVLLDALRRRHDGTKVRTPDQLARELAALRQAGNRVVFTNGCFDIVHTGHINLLRGAKQQGDILVLAVNNDASIRRLKGPQRPIISETDRLDLLSELQSIDYLVLFGGDEDYSGGELDTPKPLLRQLKPDVLVKGGQYAHNEVVGYEIVESYGGTVATIPHVDGRSTTDIVERIRAGS